jgi:hypothetical protein
MKSLLPFGRALASPSMFRFILALSEQQILGRYRRGTRMAHRRSLGYPGFPVESGVFDRMHVVLFKENHISGRC